VKCTHYNKLLQNFLHNTGKVNFQPSAMCIPYNEFTGWSLNLPSVALAKNDVLVIHTQDFLTVGNGVILELDKIEKHYPSKIHKQIYVIVEYDNCVKYYSGNLNIIYFPTFLYETVCDLQNYSIDYSKYNNKSNKWMCLNGQIHGVRKNVVEYLKNYNNGYLTLGDKVKLDQADLLYENYNYNNIENFINLTNIYKQSSINIVCETAYSKRKLTHITEKTLFAFLSLQVPIVIGNVGIIKWLKNLGFDMFDDIVDTSYDNSNDNVRWKLAIDNNKSLIKNGYNRQTVIDRLCYNRDLVFKLPSVFVDGLINNTIQ